MSEEEERMSNLAEERKAPAPGDGKAVAIVMAARDGFATGLAATELSELAEWHGNPYREGSMLGEVWRRSYAAGRSAMASTAGSMVGSEP